MSNGAIRCNGNPSLIQCQDPICRINAIQPAECLTDAIHDQVCTSALQTIRDPKNVVFVHTTLSDKYISAFWVKRELTSSVRLFSGPISKRSSKRK
eukprot:5431315-Ditylum_brightwellii.AAC.1